jgi:hypothetical protein
LEIFVDELNLLTLVSEVESQLSEEVGEVGMGLSRSLSDASLFEVPEIVDFGVVVVYLVVETDGSELLGLRVVVVRVDLLVEFSGEAFDFEFDGGKLGFSFD